MPVPGAAGVGSGAVGGAAAKKSPTRTHWGQGWYRQKTLPQEPGGSRRFAGTQCSPSRAQAMERRHLSGEKRRLSACLVCRMCCIG